MSKKQNKEQKIFLRKEKQVTSRNSVLRRGAKSGQTFSSSLLSIFTNEFTKLAATDRPETNITRQMEVKFWKGVTFCFVSKSLTEEDRGLTLPEFSIKSKKYILRGEFHYHEVDGSFGGKQTGGDCRDGESYFQGGPRRVNHAAVAVDDR